MTLYGKNRGFPGTFFESISCHKFSNDNFVLISKYKIYGYANDKAMHSQEKMQNEKKKSGNGFDDPPHIIS